MPFQPETGKTITKSNEDVNNAFDFWIQNTEICKSAKNIGDVLKIIENQQVEVLTDVVDNVLPISSSARDTEIMELETI